MKLWVLAVGKAGRMVADALDDYTSRIRRYWPLEVVEVREQRSGRGVSAAEVQDAEAERLLRRLPQDVELIAMTRGGEAWTSEAMATHLRSATDAGRPGVAFAIGGAYGLGETVLARAGRRLRLSDFTMPHDLARLVLLEQLYRAGTIMRGEPYHKGRAE